MPFMRTGVRAWAFGGCHGCCHASAPGLSGRRGLPRGGRRAVRQSHSCGAADYGRCSSARRLMRMIAQPDHLTVRPNLGAAATMDPLAEVLRLSSSGRRRVSFRRISLRPGASEVRIEPDDCVRFMRKPTQIISLSRRHRGPMLVALDGEPMIEVDAGEIVIFPQNAAHTLGERAGDQTGQRQRLIQQSSDGGLYRISHGGGGARHISCADFLRVRKIIIPCFRPCPRR